MLFLFVQVTNFATEFIKIKEGKIAQSSLDSGEVKSASVVRGNAGGYVSSSKKKKAK